MRLFMSHDPIHGFDMVIQVDFDHFSYYFFLIDLFLISSFNIRLIKN